MFDALSKQYGDIRKANGKLKELFILVRGTDLAVTTAAAIPKIIDALDAAGKGCPSFAISDIYCACYIAHRTLYGVLSERLKCGHNDVAAAELPASNRNYDIACDRYYLINSELINTLNSRDNCVVYAVGVEPEKYTHGPYPTIDEALNSRPYSGESQLYIFKISNGNAECKYRWSDDGWVVASL